MDNSQFLQAVLLAAKGGLAVSSARLLSYAKFLIWSMWLQSMMMRLNGGLNLEKLKWFRKMKSKKIAQFFIAKLQT